MKTLEQRLAHLFFIEEYKADDDVLVEQAEIMRRQNTKMIKDLLLIGKKIARCVTASCSCGGMGPHDDGVCPACMVWHRFKGIVK